MLGGFVVVSIMTVLICVAAVTFVLRIPQCPSCRIPLQAVEETVRDLGGCGVETVTYYECSDCSRDSQRVFILTHIG
jgi:hypothetical protein